MWLRQQRCGGSGGLNISRGLVDPTAETTGEDDPAQLDEGHAQSHATDDADVSDEGILELANASVLVDVAFPISLGSAALLLLLAAGIGDTGPGEVALGPVLVAVGATTCQVGLQDVPGIGHSLVSRPAIVLHSGGHLGGNHVF